MDSKKSNDTATLRLFWQATMLHKRWFLLGMFNPVGVICTSTLVPLFMGKAIAALVRLGGHPEHYLPYIIGSAIIGIACNRIGFTSLMEFIARTMGYLQTQALDALLRRSIGFHNDNVGGKLVSDAIDYPGAFNKLANATLTGLLPFAIIMVSGLTVIYFESWILGLFVSGMVALICTIAVLDSRRRSPMRMSRLVITKRVTSHLADTIMNVQTVKTFAHEAEEHAHHQKLNDDLVKTRIHDWRSAANAGNFRVTLLLGLQIVFVMVMVALVHRTPAILGVGIFAFSFTITLSNRLFDINTLLRSIEDGFLDASPMTAILQETPEILDKPGAQDLTVKAGALDLQDVAFSYEDSPEQDPVFPNLTLHIKPGEKIGLVGPSGGGKSTLTRLLLRFEDINGGSITIDDQNIADVTQSSLREMISYVPQEPLLFHRTIRENIAYGKPRAILETVKRAAKQAHAHEFIEKLPQGYETIVGERGVKLSGGQRQRIAIARAILKDAPLLILDEATSALDSESEVLIQDALWQLMQKRTTIVIAHRLSTIQKMDRIIVLDDGKITEEGTHRQLLKHKGLYAQLWAHQSGGFIEE